MSIIIPNIPTYRPETLFFQRFSLALIKVWQSRPSWLPAADFCVLIKKLSTAQLEYFFPLIIFPPTKMIMNSSTAICSRAMWEKKLLLSVNLIWSDLFSFSFKPEPACRAWVKCSRHAHVVARFAIITLRRLVSSPTPSARSLDRPTKHNFFSSFYLIISFFYCCCETHINFFSKTRAWLHRGEREKCDRQRSTYIHEKRSSPSLFLVACVCCCTSSLCLKERDEKNIIKATSSLVNTQHFTQNSSRLSSVKTSKKRERWAASLAEFKDF